LGRAYRTINLTCNDVSGPPTAAFEAREGFGITFRIDEIEMQKVIPMMVQRYQEQRLGD
jgi:hypothetical protein